ncbi:NFX1-type zinc finger-containing protein 1-like [Argonauta hians]
MNKGRKPFRRNPMIPPRIKRESNGDECRKHRRRCYVCKPLLEGLMQEEPSEIVLKLGSCERCLKDFLNKPVDLDTTTLFLKVLGQSFKSYALKELNNEILSILMYSTFFERVSNLIIPMRDITNQEKSFFDEILKLFQLILTVTPSHYKKVMEILGIIQMTVRDSIRELNPKIQELQNLLQSICSSKQRKEKQDSEPKISEDFRELPLVPSVEEITSNKFPVLRKNIEKGVYEDLEHYLDVQFRLIREDFVRPLRDGLASLRGREGEMENYNKNEDFHIYQNASVIDWVLDNSGFHYKVIFDVSRLGDINWEQTKRFIFGSLLCFSADNFVATYYGTVSDRNLAELKRGIITVRFFIDVTMDMVLNKQFIMLESKAFYGGVEPILVGLKEIISFDIPFQDYILYADNNIKAPKYSENGSVFDLSCLKNNCRLVYNNATRTVSVETERHDTINVNILGDNWPEASSLKFNDSQLDAFSNILSKEFSLTQGPPGTGKTYVGLQAVKVLCRNHEKWRGRPMLIVCYTNHALDQFLEGITKFLEGGIIRIGGRSSSKVLEKYFLKEVRSNLRQSSFLRSNKENVLSELSILRGEIEKKTNEYQLRKRQILSIDVLQPYMGNFFYLFVRNKPPYLFEDILEEWLGFSNLKYIEDRDSDDGTTEDPEAANIVNEVNYIEDNRKLDDDDDGISQLERSNLNLPQRNYPISKDGFEITKEDKKKFQKRLKRKLGGSKIISLEEIDLISDIELWIMPFEKRWCLYRYWVSLYATKLLEDISEKKLEYNRTAKILEELKYEEDKKILQNSLIIGMTTTGAARYRKILQEIQPRILVVEEAAEILEAHIITCLNRSCEQLILIGDHKQLQPSTNVYKLAKHFNLNISLFERMFNNDIKVKSLTWQHRMRPEIAELVQPIYPELQNHKSVKYYENIVGMSKNLFFLNHSHPENEVRHGTSKQNTFEASFIVELCCYLRKQGYDSSQITVLLTYSGQLFSIKKLIKGNPLCDNVKVTLVDNYQGEENDIILLSLVRSNEYNSIGYLKINNRVCVALSRAKKGFYAVGNFKLLAANSPLWADIISILDKRKSFGDSMELKCQNHPETCLQVKSFQDFSKAPEGGCLKPCEARLDCGHTCILMCHPYDAEHKEYVCRKDCPKILSDCQHKCLKPCYAKCNPCITIVTKIMPLCLHSQEMLCSSDVTTFSCQMPCPKELDCGHKCPNKCGESCQVHCSTIIENICPRGHNTLIECCKKDICLTPCKEILDCGHLCQENCSECSKFHTHKSCMQKCSRILVCGHECSSQDCSSCIPCVRRCKNRCNHNTCVKTCGEPCIQCMEPCQWKCEHLTCNKLCYQPCDRSPCNEPCRKKLSCGHQCVGLCGENCPILCSICNKDELQEIFFGTEDEEGARFVQLEDCNHVFEVTGLDNWMNTDVNNSEIQLKLCPRCKVPIRRNYRYGNLINKTLQDIENVKKRLIANPLDVRSLRMDQHLIRCYKESYSWFMKFFEQKVVSEANVIFMKNTIQYLKAFSELKCGKSFARWLRYHTYRYTQQEINELNLEVQRLQALKDVQKLKNSNNGQSDITDLIEEAMSHLSGFYSEKKRSDIEAIFKKIKEVRPLFNISETERTEIIGALQLPKGHWFKCQNGHIYAIGDCGGATVKSTCPECKCEIGGTNHQLLSSNTLAHEMDGASRPAWPNTLDYY